MSGDVTFRITTPHSDACRGIGWFFPNGWRGAGPVENRDRRGYRVGARHIHAPEWFVLMCNDPRCDGRSVVPVAMIVDHANASDASVRSEDPS